MPSGAVSKLALTPCRIPLRTTLKAAGKTIVCPHCGSDSFASFGVVGLSLAGFGIQCSKCTRLEYFASQPTRD